ncbi:MAG: RNA polymerase sigma factor [Sedimentisphaerales bacterium]|nr:RNA polymerase sigma factor [Sedimentisphaerales bacterium]
MLEDRILLWKAKRGDQSAFDALYERHVDTLLTVGRNLLGSAEEAEEVVQDVFTSFVASLASFQLRGSLKGFLAICVANRARDRLRKRSRLAAASFEAPRDDVSEPLELVIRDEQISRLQQALAELPPEQREVIVLKMHAGLSFQALARELGIALGTVQNRYRYGIDRLRSLLNGEVSE